MLSCKHLKGTHTYEVLAKELETINWDLGIENKIVHITTDHGSNSVKVFNVYRETAETVEEESSDEERLSCSGGNVDEDTIQPVRLLPIPNGDNDEEGVGEFLPKHIRCASHILNLVATTDAGKTLNECAIYKTFYRSAFAKAQEIWNKQSRSSKASDVIKNNVGFLLQVPTVTQWNFVNDPVGQLIAIFDHRDNLKAFNRACTILTLPLFINHDIAFLKDYHRVLHPICTTLYKLQSEEYAYTEIL